MKLKKLKFIKRDRGISWNSWILSHGTVSYCVNKLNSTTYLRSGSYLFSCGNLEYGCKNLNLKHFQSSLKEFE